MLPGFSGTFSIYRSRYVYRGHGAASFADEVLTMSNGAPVWVPGSGSCKDVICPPGSSCCLAISGIGASPACFDLSSDPAQCGRCYNACRAGEICCDGVCIRQTDTFCNCPPRVCDPGHKCCGSRCISVTGDTKNCGGCGHHCSHLEKCVNGKCCFPEGDIAGAAALLCIFTGGTDCNAIYQQLQEKACP
jgi:hypothetical protein